MPEKRQKAMTGISGRVSKSGCSLTHCPPKRKTLQQQWRAGLRMRKRQCPGSTVAPCFARSAKDRVRGPPTGACLCRRGDEPASRLGSPAPLNCLSCVKVVFVFLRLLSVLCDVLLCVMGI